MNVRTMLSKLSSAPTATKAIVVIAIAVGASSLAACALTGEDTDSSEAEFRSATTDRMPEAKWLNR